nr:MAG TPA: hypothetical protein [Caudoviricetes sp.]
MIRSQRRRDIKVRSIRRPCVPTLRSRSECANPTLRCLAQRERGLPIIRGSGADGVLS